MYNNEIKKSVERLVKECEKVGFPLERVSDAFEEVGKIGTNEYGEIDAEIFHTFEVVYEYAKVEGFTTPEEIREYEHEFQKQTEKMLFTITFPNGKIEKEKYFICRNYDSTEFPVSIIAESVND